MRISPLLALTGGMAACAAPLPPPAPPPAVVMAAPTVSAPIQIAEPAPLFDPAGLPSQAALVASVDPGRLSAFLAALMAAMPRELLQMIERDLPLANGGITGSNAAGALGIDTGRPIRMAIAITPDGRAVLEALRSVARTASPKDTSSSEGAQQLNKVMQEHHGPIWHMRLVVPATDSNAALSAIHSLLEHAEWNNVGGPAGIESLWSHREVALALSTAAGNVVVDMLMGTRLKGRGVGESVVQTLQAAGAGGGTPAPTLEGHAGRMSYSPSKLAEVGFVDGVSRMHSVLTDVDAETQGRIVNEGLHEASANFELAGNSAGAFFEKVEVTVDADPLVPTFLGHAQLGAGLRAAPGACAPSVAVDFPGLAANFDTATECLKALQAPGDHFAGPFQRSEFFERVREAGWTGELVALPFQVVSPARSTLQDRTGIDAAALLKFERFGVVLPARSVPDVFWGLLRAGTTQADAVCSAVANAALCTGKRRLKPGATVDLGDTFARLVALGGRYVVLLSRDRPTLDKLQPMLTRGPVAPMRGAASSSVIGQELRMIGITLAPVEFEAASTLEEGGQLNLVIRPVKLP